MGIDPSTLTNRQRGMIDADDRKQFGRAMITTEEALAIADAKLEGQIEDEIHRYLTLRGVKAILRSRRDKRTRNKKGQPDLIFSYRDCPIAWEIKTPTGKLRPDQETMRDAMLDDGWHWALVLNTEQAKWILDKIDSIQPEPLNFT